jgi:hypothetical protein
MFTFAVANFKFPMEMKLNLGQIVVCVCRKVTLRPPLARAQIAASAHRREQFCHMHASLALKAEKSRMIFLSSLCGLAIHSKLGGIQSIFFTADGSKVIVKKETN